MRSAQEEERAQPVTGGKPRRCCFQGRPSHPHPAAAPRRGPNRAPPYRPRHRAERSAQCPSPGPSRARRPRSAPWAAGRARGSTLCRQERSSGAAGPGEGRPYLTVPEGARRRERRHARPPPARLLTCSSPPHGPIFDAPQLRHRNAACRSAGSAPLPPRAANQGAAARPLRDIIGGERRPVTGRLEVST